MNFVRCLPNGCVAEVFIDDKLLARLESGETATFVLFETPEEGVGVPASLERIQGRLRGVALAGRDRYQARAGAAREPGADTQLPHCAETSRSMNGDVFSLGRSRSRWLCAGLRGLRTMRRDPRRRRLRSWTGECRRPRQPAAASDKLVAVCRMAPKISIVRRWTSTTATRPRASAVPTTRPFAISSTSPTPRASAIPGRAIRLQDRRLGPLLIGPAGSPGTYSTTMRMLGAARRSTKKPSFDKAYKVDGEHRRRRPGALRVVTDPISCRYPPDNRRRLFDSRSASTRANAARNIRATYKPRAEGGKAGEQTARAGLTKARRFRPFPPRQFRHPAEESGRSRSPFRRRRRNRPGNAQADGPLGDDTLESGER